MSLFTAEEVTRVRKKANQVRSAYLLPNKA